MLSHCVGSFHKSNAEPTASDFTHSKHSVLLTSDSDLTTAFASKHVLLFDPPFTCFHHTFTSFLPFVLCVFFCDWEPLLLLYPPTPPNRCQQEGRLDLIQVQGFDWCCTDLPLTADMRGIRWMLYGWTSKKTLRPFIDHPGTSPSSFNLILAIAQKYFSLK